MKVAPIDLQSERVRVSETHPFVVGLAFLPKELQRSVVRVQERLRKVDPSHIFHPAATLHITVKPVGTIGFEIDRADLQTITQTFRRTASGFEMFDVSLEGLAFFPDAVYAKVVEGREKVIDLNKSLVEALKDIAVPGAYEGDEMIPHVTLATFVTPETKSMLEEIRMRESEPIGRMKFDQVAIAKAFLNRYYGSEGARMRAFEILDVVRLRNH